MEKIRAVIMEWILYLRGYRKCGAYDSSDNRDIPMSINLIDYSSIHLGGGVDRIDLDNVPFQDQKLSDHCVGFTWAGVASSLCTRHMRKPITFNGEYIWSLIEKWGYALPEGGSYLRDGGKAIMKEVAEKGGILATDGRRYSFERFERVRPEEFDCVHKKGYQIATGYIIKVPMCDQEWVISMVGPDRGGHAFIDMDDYGGVDIGRNSWRRWGIRKHGVPTGNFWINKEFRAKLFQSFILVGPKRMK